MSTIKHCGYTYNAASVSSLGYYLQALSLETSLHPQEAQAFARVSSLCQGRTFQEHISIRMEWKRYLMEGAKTDTERHAYEQAFDILSTAWYA